MHYNEASFAQKMTGTVVLSEERTALVKQTYLHLSISVMAAIAGAYFGSHSMFILSLFSGAIGWILALVLINVIPRIAIACRHNPILGLSALVADGFVAGLVLGPAIAIASALSTGDIASGQNIVMNALIMTFLVFTAVTVVVWTSERKFSAPQGLMVGIFFSLVGATALNIFMPIGIFGLIISAAIGVFGVMILVYATSDILYNEAIDSPITGAVMLFAGLFNIFTAILRILMLFASRD